MRRAAALAVALAAFGLPASAAAKAKKRPLRCNGSASLCDRPFDRVVLPATHNSMSAASLDWAIPNQPVGLPAQVRDGIRGFLLDTHYAHRGPDGKLVTDDGVRQPGDAPYLCHEQCSIGATPLTAGLRPLAAFLRAHPHNVLLIDQEDYVTTRDWARAVAAAGLARFVYRGKPGPRWPTLRTMIRTHQQVVMLSEHKADGPSWDHLDYAGIVQETPYTWATPDLLTAPRKRVASCVPNRGGRRGSLFLMNHWSPPFAPKPVTSARVNATDAIVRRALVCRRTRGRMPTIVAVDMYRSGGLFAAVRRLNALVRATP